MLLSKDCTGEELGLVAKDRAYWCGTEVAGEWAEVAGEELRLLVRDWDFQRSKTEVAGERMSLLLLDSGLAVFGITFR